MKNKFRLTFRKELMAAFILVGVVPFAICCAALIRIFEIQAGKDTVEAASRVSSEVVERLDNIYDELELLSERIAGNVKLSKSMDNEDEADYLSMMYRELYEKTSKYRGFATFELYDTEGNCRFSTESGEDSGALPTYWGILNKAKNNPYSLVGIRGGADMYDTDTALCLARVIVPYREAKGYFVIKISYEKLATLLRGYFGAGEGILVADEFLGTICELGDAEEKNLANVIRSRYLRGENIDAEYAGNRLVFAKMENADFYVLVTRENAFSEETINSMYRILLAMAVLLLIICVVIATTFSKSFSKPIKVMRENMREVRRGNLDVVMEPVWKNEFGDLANSFNHMTSELKDYMELQVEQQKELNGTQIAMMQAQLNPHFLYNTLDTMKWVAKANHVPELATLVSKLAKILRASISEEQFVTLKSEMELVESYAEIQKIRFNGAFECAVEYSEEIEDLILPKLVIQPIVENAVIHGLEGAVDGHILVKAYVRTDCSEVPVLFVEVTDDGKGISDEEIAKLKTDNHKERKGHIGIRNVERIIKLNYGETYGLSVKKGDEKGTKVIMTFPAEETIR